MNRERRILLARVTGAFGIRGEVKLQSFTDPLASALRYQPWLLLRNGAEQTLDGVTGRETGKGLIARFPGIDDRDAAEALTGSEIWVARDRLPPPKPGEFYWVDLEGLKVANLDGIEFGTVSHLFDTGANDVMVVDGERQRLIPFLYDQFVKNVDFDNGKITVDWDADF